MLKKEKTTAAMSCELPMTTKMDTPIHRCTDKIIRLLTKGKNDTGEGKKNLQRVDPKIGECDSSKNEIKETIKNAFNCRIYLA